MTGKAQTEHFGSKFRAIFGIALIAVALVASVPVAMNFPESWPGAVLVLSVAGLGVALIATHIRLGHRARNRKRKEERNAF